MTIDLVPDVLTFLDAASSFVKVEIFDTGDELGLLERGKYFVRRFDAEVTVFCYRGAYQTSMPDKHISHITARTWTDLLLNIYESIQCILCAYD